MIWRSKRANDVVDPGVSGEVAVHFGAVNVKALIGTFPLRVTPEEIFRLPGCPLEGPKKGRIPGLPAVYILTEGWSIEYVGSTVNLHNRIGHHKAYGNYARGTWLRWVPFCLEMEPEMRILEFWAIYHLCPRRNEDANPMAQNGYTMNLFDMKIPSTALGMTPSDWARKMGLFMTPTCVSFTTAQNAANCDKESE